MEKLKNDQCTGCAHAEVCKHISAYDRTVEALVAAWEART